MRYTRLACLAATAACAAITLAPAPAAAQLYDDPRAIAMSGVRGDPVANSAVFHNPAGLSRAYLYAAEAIFVRDAAGNNVVGANIVDSKTQPKLAVGAAYGYQFSDSDAAISAEGHDVRLSLAHPLSDRIHIGIGMRYLHLDREVALAEGQEPDPATADIDLKGFTLDTGLLIDVGEGLTIGLVGENLISLDDPAVPRRAGAGVGFTADVFSMDVDVLADFDRHPDGEVAAQVDAGFELLVADVLPLRFGYTWDGALEQSWVGGGVGFLTKGEGSNGGQLTVAYRQNITDDAHYVFSAGMTLFL